MEFVEETRLFQILFEFLLEIERKIDGFDQGVLLKISGKAKDFQQNKQRHVSLL